ncbi:MAG: hypothetical protein NC393_13870 [Clostridium sp.]|nr:hypothetical protein [Clostridium sp.]MCM1173200.1 hypothetical protein [Clostridium sp.]MCM1208315.1 hypothetical protein [Ruminococcus sp.]
MRCLNCGNEIGERKVCPVCKAPIRNVLCGQDNEQKRYTDETQIMSITDFDGIEFENAKMQEEVTEHSAVKKIPEEKKAVITDENIDKLLCSKPKKKKWSVKKRVLITGLIAAVLLIIAATIIFIKDRKYWNKLVKPQIIFVHDETSYNINGNLIEKENVLNFIPNEAFLYKTSDNSCAIWAEEADGGMHISLKNKYGSFFVKKVTNDLVNICISSKGCYSAYSETWTYEKWVEDRSIEAGGKYETVKVTDLYRISPYGESKLMVSKEAPIVLSGITDTGSIIYIDSEKEETVFVSDTDEETIEGTSKKTVVYNDTGIAFLLSEKGDLYLVKGNAKTDTDSVENYGTILSQKIATEVKDFYFIDDNGYVKKAKQIENVASSESVSMMIIYVKEGTTYIYTAGKEEPSMRLLDEEIDFSKIAYIDTEEMYYEDGEIYRHYSKEENGTWTCVQTDKISEFKNCCGKGYSVLRDGTIYYHDKWDWKLDDADEIKCLAGRWVYYIKNGETYRQDVRNKKIEKLFSMNMDIELIKNGEDAYVK